MTNDARTILNLARTLYSLPSLMVCGAVYGDAPEGYLKSQACLIQKSPLRWIGTLDGPQLDRLASFVRDIGEVAPMIR